MNYENTKKLTDVPASEREAFLADELEHLFKDTGHRVSSPELAVHLHKKYHWDKRPFVSSTKRMIDMTLEGKFHLVKFRVCG